jgi:hypothetical protein
MRQNCSDYNVTKSRWSHLAQTDSADAVIDHAIAFIGIAREA